MIAAISQPSNWPFWAQLVVVIITGFGSGGLGTFIVPIITQWAKHHFGVKENKIDKVYQMKLDVAQNLLTNITAYFGADINLSDRDSFENDEEYFSAREELNAKNWNLYLDLLSSVNKARLIFSDEVIQQTGDSNWKLIPLASELENLRMNHNCAFETYAELMNQLAEVENALRDYLRDELTVEELD